jgi:hypothetical protein
MAGPGPAVKEVLTSAAQSVAMLRVVCLAWILGVAVDQLLLDGTYTAVVLRMLSDIRAHF